MNNIPVYSLVAILVGFLAVFVVMGWGISQKLNRTHPHAWAHLFLMAQAAYFASVGTAKMGEYRFPPVVWIGYFFLFILVFLILYAFCLFLYFSWKMGSFRTVLSNWWNARNIIVQWRPLTLYKVDCFPILYMYKIWFWHFYIEVY